MYDDEKKFLMDRKYTCPICDTQITAKAVKSNSARFVETKADLRPIYSNVDVTKYDSVCCNMCGYSALSKDFTNLTQSQKNLIKEKIQANFVSKDRPVTDAYTTEEAITRLKMVLLCTVSKNAKSSEIGNVCLKISWLYQDLADEIAEDDPNAETKKERYMAEADKAAQNAYENLKNARMTEDFPIAGMNETTLDYLLSYFAYKKGDYQLSMQYLSGVVTNRETSPRLKEKSLELKDLVNAKLHAA